MRDGRSTSGTPRLEVVLNSPGQTGEEHPSRGDDHDAHEYLVRLEGGAGDSYQVAHAAGRAVQFAHDYGNQCVTEPEPDPGQNERH